MKKSVEVKKELVNNYYKNASKHVFQDMNKANKLNFYKVGLINKKDSEEQYAYSIEIVGGDVSIFFKKINESDKAEHSMQWFPVYNKRVAVTQSQNLRDTMEMLEVYTFKTIVDYEELSYGFKRINFPFIDKFNTPLSLEKNIDEMLQSS